MSPSWPRAWHRHFGSFPGPAIEGKTEPPEKCPVGAPRKLGRVCGYGRGVCHRLWLGTKGMQDIPAGTGTFGGEHVRGSGALSHLSQGSMLSPSLSPNPYAPWPLLPWDFLLWRALDTYLRKKGWDDPGNRARTESSLVVGEGTQGPFSVTVFLEPGAMVENVLSTQLLLELLIVASGLIPWERMHPRKMLWAGLNKKLLGTPYRSWGPGPSRSGWSGGRRYTSETPQPQSVGTSLYALPHATHRCTRLSGHTPTRVPPCSLWGPSPTGAGSLLHCRAVVKAWAQEPNIWFKPELHPCPL